MSSGFELQLTRFVATWESERVKRGRPSREITIACEGILQPAALQSPYYKFNSPATRGHRWEYRQSHGTPNSKEVGKGRSRRYPVPHSWGPPSPRTRSDRGLLNESIPRYHNCAREAIACFCSRGRRFLRHACA